MDDDRTYHLLEQCLNQISQIYTFDYGLIDMRKMLRPLHHDQSELGSTLSSLELEHLDRFAMPKKKLQWLSGRYAVKTALFKYMTARDRLLELNCIDILNKETSAPYLVQYPDIQISITHSYPYCIGAVSDYSIGIDLEKVMKLRDSLINQYFHPNEITNLGELGTDDYHIKAITYWTRKEAVSKLLELGLKMDFKQIDTVNDSLVCSKNLSSLIKLKSDQITDYCFSLAIEASKPVESNEFLESTIIFTAKIL